MPKGITAGTPRLSLKRLTIEGVPLAGMKCAADIERNLRANVRLVTNMMVVTLSFVALN